MVVELTFSRLNGCLVCRQVRGLRATLVWSRLMRKLRRWKLPELLRAPVRADSLASASKALKQRASVFAARAAGRVTPPLVGALDLTKSRRRKSWALASQFRLRPNCRVASARLKCWSWSWGLLLRG